MTDQARVALTLAGRLMAYPDEQLYASLPALMAEAARLGPYPDTSPFATACAEFGKALQESGQHKAASHYVEVFDHMSTTSPYLAWHRYGNDRGQGKALAALNGLYRTAGFEPVEGCMPDYLPRMLEFLAIAPDWAQEALLDGFGPEILGIVNALVELESIYGPMLNSALTPLVSAHPELFQTRRGPDLTKRPMAQPEAEPIRPL